jgi:FAD/FMN-containing dehydrogenase
VPKTVDIKKERKNFTTLTNADIKAFKEIVGTENVVSDLDDV